MNMNRSTICESTTQATFQQRTGRLYWLTVAAEIISRTIADELETGFTAEEQARAIAAVQFHAGMEIAAISETMNE